jgi:hypothetical protein
MVETMQSGRVARLATDRRRLILGDALVGPPTAANSDQPTAEPRMASAPG